MWDTVELLRAQAQRCLSKANEISDAKATRCWVAVGETWLRLAEAADKNGCQATDPAVSTAPEPMDEPECPDWLVAQSAQLSAD
jgi:hypothetical protein